MAQNRTDGSVAVPLIVQFAGQRLAVMPAVIFAAAVKSSQLQVDAATGIAGGFVAHIGAAAEAPCRKRWLVMMGLLV